MPYLHEIIHLFDASGITDLKFFPKCVAALEANHQRICEKIIFLYIKMYFNPFIFGHVDKNV